MGAGGGADEEEPVLVRVDLIVQYNHLIRTGIGGCGIEAGGGGRVTLGEVDVSLAAHNLQKGAPGPIGGGLGADAEVIIATAHTGVGLPGGPGACGSGIPGDVPHPIQFSGQRVGGVARCAGGQVNTDEVSAFGSLRRGEQHSVHGLILTVSIITELGGELVALDVKIRIACTRGA